MTREDIVRYIESKIAGFLSRQPWWYGHMDKPKPKREATQAQLDALAKARQVRANDANEREQRFQIRLTNLERNPLDVSRTESTPDVPCETSY